MDNLKKILFKLKSLGCSGIKISYEDEGALLNEIITMRYLTSYVGIDLSIKIGGCEAKRDIVDCINLNTNIIVAPMIESAFALKKFSNSLKQYNYIGERGFNLETIQAYKSLNEISKEFALVDFVTFGRVDFVTSLEKDRTYVNSNEMLDIVSNVFIEAKKHNIKCVLGGAISVLSKEFISKLIDKKLLDNFETRYIIFDTQKIQFENFEELMYTANLFEVEWLKMISERYNFLFNKDINRIKMIEERINNNIKHNNI
jgi:4-hydroxy-2-oxoheptanedioate aldolase